MLANACATSLCRFVSRLFMCLFLQHERKWRHVSFWHDGHGLHRGHMSYLRKCFLQKLPRYLS